MRTISEYIKMTLAVLMVLASSGMCVLRLMKVQVVNKDMYNHSETSQSVYTQKIPATRGEIVDANQMTLVGNHVTYAVVIDKKNFPSDNQESNAILLTTWRKSLTNTALNGLIRSPFPKYRLMDFSGMQGKQNSAK